MLRFITSKASQNNILSKLSDEELVKRFQERKEPAVVGELFNRYIHLVFAVCMKYLKDYDLARDFSMIVFENLDKKILKFEVRNFSSWLLTMTRNNCLMELRKTRREYLVDNSRISQVKIVENQEEVHLKEQSKLEGLMLVSMMKLKECQRKCLDLMYFKEKSYKEIALLTGYSISEVKSYIQNGKRNLRKLLSDGEE